MVSDMEVCSDPLTRHLHCMVLSFCVVLGLLSSRRCDVLMFDHSKSFCTIVYSNVMLKPNAHDCLFCCWLTRSFSTVRYGRPFKYYYQAFSWTTGSTEILYRLHSQGKCCAVRNGAVKPGLSHPAVIFILSRCRRGIICLPREWHSFYLSVTVMG